MQLPKKLLFLLTAILFVTFLSAQQITVTGKLTDAQTSEPVAGASIVIRGNDPGTSSREDGSFTILVSPNQVLNISMIGYKPVTISINGQTLINVSLVRVAEELGQIVLVGSRRGGRVRTESPVPVDVIAINQAGLPTAKMDLTSILNAAAPSFNYNKQSGADGSDHIDLGTLRGLGPDQTLVLINGKRRHQTAFVGLFGTRGRGNSGADLNAFPQSIVDRIEILRDGASAQYGSDAMAGVINIILKRDINRWTINAGWSGYYDTKYNAYKTRKSNQYYYSKPIDGGALSLSLNNGFALGSKGGFINLSFDFLKQAKTFRQVADTNVMTNPKALPLNYGRRAFGDGSVTTAGAMYNLELPMGTKGTTSFYSFGGYNYKASDAYAYTRNWSARPDRFPVDNSGDLIYVPSIMRTADDGEIYYNPHIQTHITDFSLAAGIKGEAGKEWNWDLSNTVGRNDFHYYGDKTFNASIVNAATPTHFDDGGFNFLQNTLNLDFSKHIPAAQGLNLGLGAEFRYERYSIYKGEEASYTGYTNPFDQAPGAQGFPGFGPNDVVKENRSTIGVYGEAELNITRAWLADVAARFENYSDFGSILTGKFATRLRLASNFNIRGSVSTGFRAPSLQQINFSNTLTSFSGGQLVQSRIARNNDAVTKAAGIPALKEETSFNTSLGFSWKPVSSLTLTLDGYMVKVKNRIVLSGLFSANDNTLPAEFTAQLQSLGVSTAQFFDNAVNTTNYGLDIVADYTKRWNEQGIRILLTGNLQHMTVDDVHVPAKLDDSYAHRKTFFSDREEAMLLASAPRAKASLNLDYTLRKAGAGIRFTYYGKIRTMGFGWTGLASAAGTGGPGDPDISGSFTGIDPYVDIDGYSDQVHVVPEAFNYGGKVTTDIYLSYRFSSKLSLFIGADNLFNVHPDFAAVPNARYESFDNETGGAWESVQMGFNGLRLFSKLSLSF
ncbi:MAG: TonB-dependent receptor [Chitinophagaceae bacterium]